MSVIARRRRIIPEDRRRWSKSWYKLQTVAGTGCRARQGPSSVAGPLNIRESCRKFAHTATGYRWNWSNWPRVHARFVLAVSRTRATARAATRRFVNPRLRQLQWTLLLNYPTGVTSPHRKMVSTEHDCLLDAGCKRFVIPSCTIISLNFQFNLNYTVIIVSNFSHGGVITWISLKKKKDLNGECDCSCTMKYQTFHYRTL